MIRAGFEEGAWFLRASCRSAAVRGRMSHPPHPLATLAQVISTPSALDGIPAEVEDDLRVAGCMMIQEAGIMLAL